MSLLRSYRTIEEFEREEIRPGFRIGFSLDDIEDNAFEAELSFEENDGFELDCAEESEDADDEEEGETE